MFELKIQRGMEAVKILTRNFPDRTWWLPNLICDEVHGEVAAHIRNIKFYQVYSDLKFGLPDLDDTPSLFYAIDYFGKEFGSREMETHHQKLMYKDVIIVRDSVWFPFPYTPVAHNHIWFNSFRKIVRGATGGLLVSPFELELPRPYYQGLYNFEIDWREVQARKSNFNFLKERLYRFRIPRFEPEFPTVLPIRLKNREVVVKNLHKPMPGMWKNSMGLSNRLYDDLLIIPIDSRFDHFELDKLAGKILELGQLP